MGRVPILSFLAAALVTMGGCSTHTIRVTVLGESSENVVSLLGDTLRNVPVDPREGPTLIANLLWARGEAARNPASLPAQLLLARRTAQIGRLREAIGLLTQESGTRLSDPRLFRLRGEYLLRIRALDLAITDLRRAEQLLPTAALIPEDLGDLPDTGERTSLQYQTSLLLGMALYCKGQFALAREALVRAGNRSGSGDELVESVLWLFFTLRRTDPDQAVGVLDLVTADWTVNRRKAEYELLLAYKGIVPSDTIRARALASAGGDERSLYRYGIGYLHLVRDRRNEAAAWFGQARATPNWTTLSYLAAEAELTRIPGGTDIGRHGPPEETR